jgi:hypothetical protein
MVWRRILEIVGTLIIGDGIAFLVTPRPHMLIWVDALDWPLWRRIVRWFANHPAAGRVSGVVEVALGAWMLACAYDEVD